MKKKIVTKSVLLSGNRFVYDFQSQIGWFVLCGHGQKMDLCESFEVHYPLKIVT